MHPQKASACVSSPSPGCAAASHQTPAPPLQPQQLQGCSWGWKGQWVQVGTQVLAQGDSCVSAQPHFGQPVGDSGTIPSLLPSLSSGSFTNCLLWCPGRGLGWGSGESFPAPPPSSACHQLRPTAMLLPHPGIKHWCGHLQGSAGMARCHCHCHCHCWWHLPLLVCASTSAAGNVHLTWGWCNTVLGYVMMLFALWHWADAEV